ncbi:MAG TPA: transcriptional regulator [Chromatiaceae bacterium]|nr:transcriptional regulator [Chromatiaceae bacterium]
MKTLTIDVADRETLASRTQAAFRGERVGELISFGSPEALWRTLTPNRWAILKALAGHGAVGVRVLARQLGRDVKGVHTDTHG